MKKISLIILACLFSTEIFSQNQFVGFPTPNAADLGKFGQIPVSYFNGIPEISIPIYSINLKQIQIPISMRYNSGGIKPEDHPGWTGMGWTLNAGGAITRVINGRRDETNILNIWDEIGLKYKEGSTFGYYYSCSEFAVENWSSEAFLTKQVTYDPFSIIYYKDTEPDEFIFNVAGMSGSFFFTFEDGVRKIKIKSKENYNLKIQESLSLENFQIAENFPTRDYGKFDPSLLNVRKTFWKFTLIDGKGIKYVFGGNANSIDFTSSPSPFNSTSTVPTTWNLTEIITPNNESIKYEYKKDGNVIINRNQTYFSAVYFKNSSYGEASTNKNNDDNLLMQHPAYLTRISATNGDEIKFSTSKSKELKYTWLAENIYNFSLPFLRGNNDILYSNHWLQLDTIAISNIKKVKLIYTNAENQRLRLGEIKLLGGSDGIVQSYQFKYNTNNLPVYNSKQTDHWGYYNGKYYGNISRNADFVGLDSFRIPDGNLMKSETLEKIYYPTGGISTFEYEPHTYSKIALQYDSITPFSIKKENGIAGGLRIKRITSQEREGNTAGQIIKEYSYQNFDGTSSGILSGKPVYIAKGKNHATFRVEDFSGFTFFKNSKDYSQYYENRSEQLLNPLSNTNGSHVTYSRVIEKHSNGSSSIYSYTNHDQFMDQPPVSVYTNFDSKTIHEPFISRELERGLLLSTAHRNSQNILIDSVCYEYNKNSSRYNNFAKSIVTNRILGIGAYDFLRFSSLKIYTFYPYLEKTTHYYYGSNANNTPVIKSTSYLYNSNNLTSQSTVTLNSLTSYTTKFYYPSDYPGDLNYMDLVSRNIIAIPIEEIESNSTKEISRKRNNYRYNTLGTIRRSRPSSIEHSTTGESGFRTVMTYDKFDNSDDNILQYTRMDGVKVSYLWGYDNQYPIAEFVNAELTQITGAMPELGITWEDIYSANMSKINLFRQKFPNVSINTYTYKPLVGILTATDPRGVTTYYDYDSFGRLKETYIMENSIKKVVQVNNYHYQNK